MTPVKTTNLAQEIAELCRALHHDSPVQGDVFIAGQFGVVPWSLDFYQIVTAILEKIDELERLIISLNLDSAIVNQARHHLTEIRSAFDRDAMAGPWQGNGAARLGPLHNGPLMMFSAALRDFSYPVPSDEEREEIRSDAQQLLEWLDQHQLQDRDFVRQCLIDGVRTFLFRLDKVRWLGWGYAADSLRDVISAYLMIDRGMPVEADPMALAMLQKTMAGFRKAFEFVSGVREAGDNVQFLLTVSQATWRLAQPAATFIAGYLSSSAQS